LTFFASGKPFSRRKNEDYLQFTGKLKPVKGEYAGFASAKQKTKRKKPLRF